MNRGTKVSFVGLIFALSVLALSNLSQAQAFPIELYEDWDKWEYWGPGNKAQLRNAGYGTAHGEHGYDYAYCYIDHVQVNAYGKCYWDEEIYEIKVRIRIWDGPLDTGTIKYYLWWTTIWTGDSQNTGWQTLDKYPNAYCSVYGYASMRVEVKGHFFDAGWQTNTREVTFDY
ncbi:MAG: hypothetical protein ACFFGZ_14120 [Candidatus Thorarchaeota archaeon]